MANVVIGNLAATPELRFTESGTAYAHVVILRNRSRKIGDEWIKQGVARHEYTVWEEFARQVVNTLTKGMRVIAIVSDQQSKGFLTKNGEAASAMTGRLEDIGQAVNKYAPKTTEDSGTKPETKPETKPKTRRTTRAKKTTTA